MIKTINWIQHKRTESEKTNEKDGKALYTLMNNAIYSKTRENLRNRIDMHWNLVNKVLMYEFCHDFIKNKHDNNSKLLFTDTYSVWN